jgi:lipid II:glycine glycyltransferase (peptidoglycan interpeptide bridge formation enzyme)
MYYNYYCKPCKFTWRSSSLNTYKNKCVKCKRLCEASFSHFECIYDETKNVINSIRNRDVYENFRGHCDILKDKIIYVLNKNQSNFNKELR